MSSSSADTSLLRQFSGEALSSVLRSLPGTEKHLVLELRVMKCLNRVAGMELLKNCGVKRVFKLDDYTPVASGGCPVFVVPSSLDWARQVIKILRSSFSQFRKQSVEQSPVAIFVPILPQAVLTLFEEEGLADKVTLREYAWQLIPVDEDLLSMELPSFFRRTIVDGDLTYLGAVSKTLMGLQGLYGHFGTSVGVGRKSSAILTQLKSLESIANQGTAGKGEFSHLVLMDRDVDFISCLLSPVTYEALLDEVFGINLGIIDFASATGQVKPASLQIEKLELSSRDKIFEQIRSQHFSNIFSFLSHHARQIRQAQNKTNSMNVAEMRDFVENSLSELKLQSRAVAAHIGASETIQAEKGYFYENLLPLEHEVVRGGSYRPAAAFIEKAIAQKMPFEIVLRFVCLLSICFGGLPSSDYAKFKKLICDAYGHRYLPLFARLARSNLLVNKGSKKSSPTDAIDFATISSRLGLIGASSDEPSSSTEPTGRDPSAVFNRGFCPAICRIVQRTIESPAAVEELVKLLPNSVAYQRHGKANGASRTVLVFFVGGYTLAETAALKALQSSSNFRFLVAGTSKECGRTIVSSLID